MRISDLSEHQHAVRRRLLPENSGRGSVMPSASANASSFFMTESSCKMVRYLPE
jgi:hypothetical protein